MKESTVRTANGEVYIIKEFSDGETLILSNREPINFRKYDEGDLRMFKRCCDDLKELEETINDLTIKDIAPQRFNELKHKSKRYIEEYNRWIPNELKEKFYFNTKQLEDKIYSIQREFKIIEL
jgi:hypothetical protein